MDGGRLGVYGWDMVCLWMPDMMGGKTCPALIQKNLLNFHYESLVC